MRHRYETVSSVPLCTGRIIAVRTDEVRMPDGATVARDVVHHPGAVGVVALDDRDRVVLVRQYRHPVGERLWEIPAGLLDVPGERALDAAARELAEETGLRAASWQVLVDVLTSPGMTDEAIRLYLARDLTQVPRPPGRDEESDMEQDWVSLPRAVARVLAGDIRNGPTCAGLLAADQALRPGSAALRAADAPWRDRPERAGRPT